MTLLSLFLSFLKIGAFSVGGGYAALPLVQSEIVEIHGWLTISEFTDLITIAEMTPGPMAINSATFVGTRIANFPGAVAAVSGCILPSMVLVSLLALVYRKHRNLLILQTVLAGLRAAVVAFILSAFLSIAENALFTGRTFDFKAAGLFLFTFLIIRKLKASPVLAMASAGILNLVLSIIFKWGSV